MVIRTRQRHPLDDVLVADPGDVHGQARLPAQAQRPDLALIGIGERFLEARVILLENALGNLEPPHRLLRSRVRRIRLIIDSRKPRDGNPGE